ncbi:MAG: hypothetical protein KBS59_04290, partial [Clostridiales bacterium]|nr:hypothetical protein [Clostridiales bacterium]
LGLCDAFSVGSADFTKMATYDGQNIYISDVIHKTHIELNEVGTRAAAVTLIEMKCGCAEPMERKTIDITLDRPFVYMIVDTANNMPLFMGVVTGIDK